MVYLYIYIIHLHLDDVYSKCRVNMPVGMDPLGYGWVVGDLVGPMTERPERRKRRFSS